MLFIYKRRKDAEAGVSIGSVRLQGATLMARKVRPRPHRSSVGRVAAVGSRCTAQRHDWRRCAALYQDDKRVFVVHGPTSVAYTFRAANEAVRSQWLRALALTGRGQPVNADTLAGAAPATASARRGSSSGSVWGGDVSVALPSASTASLLPAPSTGAAASGADAAGEPQYADRLDALLTSLRYQRQTIERMLREAAELFQQNSRLAELKCGAGVATAAILSP